MKNIKILSLIIATTLFGCVADDEFDAPDLSGLCNNTITANKEISNLSSISNPTLYTADDVIEGYVVSSDEDGNFYKSISIQKEDGSIGFTVPVDQTNLHNEYRPGTKVAIKLKDRYVGRSNSMIAIGNLFEGSVGRIGATEYKNVIIRKCNDTKKVEDLVKVRTIAEAAQNQYLNTLIEIQNVQFSDASLNKKFYDVDVTTIGGATNHTLLEVVGGASVIARVSEFASFANKPIPSGSGKVTGIMTKFGSTFQFMIVKLSDVKLDSPRQTIDLSPPKGGTAITYTGSFTENFESYTQTGAASEIFPKYVNDAAEGTKYWRIATFGGNKYIQFSAFSSSVPTQEQLNRTLFIVPIDFTAANNMSFKTKAGFDNGAVLKVYTTTNYIPLGNINNATLTDITSNFAISSGPTSGYPANFTNSGVFNFPTGLTGNGFIVFEYTGGYSFSPARTTTMQIDDIVVN
jgi:hypothetical protein